MIRSFFCTPFISTIIFFLFSFELYGKFRSGVVFGAICYLPGFKTRFLSLLKQFVSLLETICFSVETKCFQGIICWPV